MNVSDLVEHEDGSATMTVDLTKEDLQFCIKYVLEQSMRNLAKEVGEYKYVVDKDDSQG